MDEGRASGSRIASTCPALHACPATSCHAFVRPRSSPERSSSRMRPHLIAHVVEGARRGPAASAHQRSSRLDAPTGRRARPRPVTAFGDHPRRLVVVPCRFNATPHSHKSSAYVRSCEHSDRTTEETRGRRKVDPGRRPARRARESVRGASWRARAAILHPPVCPSSSRYLHARSRWKPIGSRRTEC